jgi:penicillin amidase
MRKRKGINLILSLIGPITLIVLLSMPIGPLFGGLGIIQPIGGIFDNGAPEPGDQVIALHGLDAEVEVIIDHLGVPHIYADSTDDAFMALGYMQAKDRLFQVVMQNAFAAGRVSEIVGGYAARSDMFYRSIGLARSAQDSLDWFEANAPSDPDVQEALDGMNALVVGANAYISTLTSANLPMEFKVLGYTPKPWTVVDCFVNAKMLAWGLAGGLMDFQRLWWRETLDNDTLYNDLIPDVMPYTVPIIQEQVNLSLAEYPLGPGKVPLSAIPDTSSIVLAEEATIPQDKLESVIKMMNDVIRPFGDLEFVGSNNWAVGGNKSSTGYPIVAGDPHLGHQAPSVWYEAHIVVPGVLDVTGTTFPGLPAVMIGHNDHIAYSFTNVGADVNDVFVEELNPSNPDQYRYNGEWRNFTIHQEDIHTAEGEVIPFTVKESVHGPCIDSGWYNLYGYDTETHPNLAMNWTISGATRELVAMSLLMQADDIDEAIDAFYWWDTAPQNCVFGDDSGNIGMLVVGRFPIRAGYTGEYPVTALNDSVGMVSWVPYAHNPREVNPSRGFVSSANQRTIDPANYAYDILGPQANGYRGRRIHHLLDVNDDISVDDMKRFQCDVVEVRAEVMVPYIVDAWDAVGDGNSTIADAVDLLRVWQHDMEPDLVAPTIWMYLLDALHYEVFDEIRTINNSIPLSRNPILEEIIVTDNTWYLDDHTTTPVETRDEILVRALISAIDDLSAEWADEPNWEYGNRHVIEIDHLGGFTTIGDEQPLRGQLTLNVAGGWRPGSGPSTRLIADLSNIQMSYMAYPGGQSGNIFSPHFADIFEIWYSYNATNEQHGYHILYFYSTADAFRTADTDGSWIERTITLVP